MCGGTRPSNTGCAATSCASSSSGPRSAKMRNAADAAVGISSPSSSSKPASTSCPWRATRVWCDRRSSLMRSAVARIVMSGTDRRSASTPAIRSSARAGSATFRRPTRHAAFSRRAGGRGSSFLSTDRRRRVSPRRSRSTATRPPTVTTIGEPRSCRAGVAPASVSASRNASRRGATQRSSSSGRSGRPNVSATGPGPNTGPAARASSPSAVIGRL